MSQRNPTETEIQAYAEAFIEKNDESNAWRTAFPNSKANQKTINNKAYEFHQLGEVRGRILELQDAAKEIAKKNHGITTESLLIEYEEARLLAISIEKPAAMAACTTGKARLLGLDKIDHISSDGTMSPNATLTQQQALALLKQNGLT